MTDEKGRKKGDDEDADDDVEIARDSDDLPTDDDDVEPGDRRRDPLRKP